MRTYYDGFGLNSNHLLFLATLLLLPGCTSIVNNATTGVTDNISQAISNQNDPATVRDGAPSFLLMLDGFIQGDPENIDLLLSVQDDEEEDILTGSSGRDLFYDGLGDILTDIKTK